MGRRAQSGFTLIEVMIVVAVIGILASVAMPAFHDYARRAKITEALLALSTCRDIVSEIYLAGGPLPAAGNWGCEATNPSKFVERIDTDANGIVYVTLGNQIADLRLSQKDVTLEPLNSSNAVMSDLDSGNAVRRWRCGNPGLSPGGGALTDLNPSYLPSTCRGF